MNFLIPALKIHSWGGLGSQLFSVALLKDFERIHPGRTIKIVLHTSGVTRRIPEVVELFPEISFIYIDDFSPSRLRKNQSSRNFRTVFLSYLKQLIFSMKFTQSFDDDSFEKLRFWTLSVRGHYSYRTITREFLELLEKKLHNVSQKNRKDKAVCVIHYRLGDLLLLDNKKPIEPTAILKELKRISKNSDFAQIEIYSDTPKHAMELLNPLGLRNISTPNADTVSLLERAIQSEYFLGTSSKISFWIVAIRSVVFNKPSSIPAGNFLEISGLLNKEFKNVYLYGD